MDNFKIDDLKIGDYNSYLYEMLNKKSYLGVKGKGCIFCGRPYYKLAFSSDSHAIPEFIGNKSLIHYNECDECNTYFSSNLENHLDNYTKSARTLARIKGKKKVPAIKSHNGDLRIDTDLNKEHFTITGNSGTHYILDQENKKLILELEKGSYIPLSVYKCLAKMALSIMPLEQIKNYTVVNKWIRGKIKKSNLMDKYYLIHGFIKGYKPLFEQGFCMIFLRKINSKDSDCDCLFKVCFGNFELQIAVPSDKELKSRYPKTITWIPSFNDEIKKTLIDLSSNKLLKKSKEIVEFGFNEITQTSI